MPNVYIHTAWVKSLLMDKSMRQLWEHFNVSWQPFPISGEYRANERIPNVLFWVSTWKVFKLLVFLTLFKLYNDGKYNIVVLYWIRHPREQQLVPSHNVSITLCLTIHISQIATHSFLFVKPHCVRSRNDGKKHFDTELWTLVTTKLPPPHPHPLRRISRYAVYPHFMTSHCICDLPTASWHSQ